MGNEIKTEITGLGIRTQIWYVGNLLTWDGEVHGDQDLDELQTRIDFLKSIGTPSAVIHRGSNHYFYLGD